MATCDIGQAEEQSRELEQEMENLHSIFEAVYAYPTTFSLTDVDIFGRSFPVHGMLGGDHLIFLDFARRYDLNRRIADARAAGHDEVAAHLEDNRSKVGVMIADVSGHRVTDTLLAAMLHQAFLVGVDYELGMSGHVTPRLFEILNTRFYQSSSVTKFVTMIYGEIDAKGTFRFISAGHPRPLIYSAEYGRFVDIDRSLMTTVHPIGLFPTENDIDQDVNARPTAVSPRHHVNQVSLMNHGDVLLLFTDGVFEHLPVDLTTVLEPTLQRMVGRGSREIVEAARADLSRFGPPGDDMSLVAIQRR